MPITERALRAFEATYDTALEESALESRDEFVRRFPAANLGTLTLEQYAVGKGETFCAHAEAKTKAWAVIQGATAFKFGVYFGKTQSDPAKRYRSSRKFGDDPEKAFAEVRARLVELVEAGRRKNFAAIDANPLSQMFKAKVLSLYFPRLYLNVCSEESLVDLADAVGIPEQKYNSRLQYELRRAKQANVVSARWSNPKFMEFLFATYLPKEVTTPRPPIRKPTARRHPEVNFKKLQELWGRVGRRSEEFALKHERKRLRKAGLGHLVSMIEDIRKRPSYGYDFKSFSAEGCPRYIEVKTAGRDKVAGKEYRLFLSERERLVSVSADHAQDYYFYLVFNDSEGRPFDVCKIRAETFYANSAQESYVYIQRFIRDDVNEG